jgi:hypothetical protein
LLEQSDVQLFNRPQRPKARSLRSRIQDPSGLALWSSTHPEKEEFLEKIAESLSEKALLFHSQRHLKHLNLRKKKITRDK